MKRLHWLWALLLCAVALPAEAQIGSGTLRFSIDADMLSMAMVEVENERGRTVSDTTYFGVGPNQLGGARGGTGLPTPVGLGFGYALSSTLILGGRLGFGFDVASPDGGDDNNTRYLAISLMPGITFIPVGHKAKMFLSASPLLQVDRERHENWKARTLLGGFGLGIGVLIFTSNSLSVDLGFHFEGRFGGRERDIDNNPFDEDEADIRDLRTLVRLGISFWK